MNHDENARDTASRLAGQERSLLSRGWPSTENHAISPLLKRSFGRDAFRAPLQCEVHTEMFQMSPELFQWFNSPVLIGTFSSLRGNHSAGFQLGHSTNRQCVASCKKAAGPSLRHTTMPNSPFRECLHNSYNDDFGDATALVPWQCLDGAHRYH